VIAVLAACREQEPPALPAPAPAAERPAQGKWSVARDGASTSGREAAADVKALPYLQGYRPAQDRPVVVQHDPGSAFQGLNLYVSGHAAEAVLMDMQGTILHRWRYPLRRLWPALARDPAAAKLEYWRRAYVYPNGDLLGIYEGQGLVAFRGGIHHDLFVAEDGSIYVLDREGKIIPRIHPTRGVLEDFVTVLSPTGDSRRKISILRCFERSPYASLVETMPLRQGDRSWTAGSRAGTRPSAKGTCCSRFSCSTRWRFSTRIGGRSSGRKRAAGGTSTNRLFWTTGICSCSTIWVRAATGRG
jgi:hypothetical protein